MACTGMSCTLALIGAAEHASSAVWVERVIERLRGAAPPSSSNVSPALSRLSGLVRSAWEELCGLRPVGSTPFP